MPNSKENGLIAILNKAVSDSYTMYLNYKRYHWNVYGPLFRELHLLFDEHSKAVLGTVDEFAERVKMLGGEAIGSLTEVVEQTTLKQARPGMTPKEMLEQAKENHEQLIAGFSQAIRLASDTGDYGTADLFTETIRLHEKQLWFIREHLGTHAELLG